MRFGSQPVGVGQVRRAHGTGEAAAQLDADAHERRTPEAMKSPVFMCAPSEVSPI